MRNNLRCCLLAEAVAKFISCLLHIVAELCSLFLTLAHAVVESLYEPLNVKLVIRSEYTEPLLTLSKFGLTIYELIILPFASSLVVFFTSFLHSFTLHLHCCRPVSGQSFYTTTSVFFGLVLRKYSLNCQLMLYSVARIFISFKG